MNNRELDIFIFDKENLEFSEEERRMVNNIGAENFDYCLTALLQHRYPEHDINLHEKDQVIRIDGNLDLEFNSNAWMLDSENEKISILYAVNYIGFVFIENMSKIEKV